LNKNPYFAAAGQDIRLEAFTRFGPVRLPGTCQVLSYTALPFLVMCSKQQRQYIRILLSIKV
jgi:hypothetical protein